MPSGILRVLVFLAAAGVIAAATHANVLHAGGYGSQDAPLIITLAILLALGMAFVGVCFNEGKRSMAVLLTILILAGEAYWVLINAEREVASLDAASASVAELQSARASAQARVDRAEAAKRQADAAAISEAAKKDCASNCAKLLLAGQEQAARELDAARAALVPLPEPRSVTPLSDRLGIPQWAWQLLLAGLRSLGITGGSLAIGMALHPKRAAKAQLEEPSPQKVERPARVQIMPLPRLNKREHVAAFLKAVGFQPDPLGRASLRGLHVKYNDWCQGEKLPAADLGKELRSIIDALGLKCEQSGRDVIVHGAAITD